VSTFSAKILTMLRRSKKYPAFASLKHKTIRLKKEKDTRISLETSPETSLETLKHK
jgi:hypothetical protein